MSFTPASTFASKTKPFSFLGNTGNFRFLKRKKVLFRWLIYSKRVRSQLWLVLETRNVTSGSLFWRQCGYVGIPSPNQIFYCEPAARWNFLKLGGHAPSIERKRFRVFSDFSYDFKDFGQIFRVYFLICHFSQERLDGSS